MEFASIFSGTPFYIEDFTLIFKLFLTVALILYIIFAAVVMRQVSLMLSSLQGYLDGSLRLIALLHLLAALALLGVALVLL